MMKNGIENVRKAIYESNADIVEKLLNSKENAKGDFYKATYKVSYSDDYEKDSLDPAGNNLLLHIISKGAFNFNKDDKIIAFTKNLALFVIKDAKSKLSSDDFKKFINFEYSKDNDCYKNSPLTLAVKCGLLDVAESLVKEGADLLYHVPKSYGDYTSLHMLYHRLPFIDLKKNDVLDKNIQLIKTIVKTDKNSLGQKDIYGHQPQDIIGYKFPQHTDIKNIQIKNKGLLEESGLKGNVYYSFKELMSNYKIKDFLEKKGVQTVDFKNLIKISAMPDEKGHNFFYNNKNGIKETSSIYQNLHYDVTLNLKKLHEPDLYSNYIENKKDEKVDKFQDQLKNG
jgi:hypothetical protein